MRQHFDALLTCACGRKFRESSSPSFFKCSWCVEREEQRKQLLVDEKIAAATARGREKSGR
jgi:hypothetical protein